MTQNNQCGSHDFSIWYEFTSNVKFCSKCDAVQIDRITYIPERRKRD